MRLTQGIVVSTVATFLLLSIFMIPSLRFANAVPEPQGNGGDGASMQEATADERANRFFEASFQELLERSPMFQTQLGLKDDYDQWDDLSEAHLAEEKGIIERQLADLRATVPFEELSHQAKVSYLLFVDDRETRLENFVYRHHNYPVNQMRGWQSRVPAFLINYHKIESVEDAEAYIARLGRVDELFDQLMRGLETRADKGILAPRFVYAHVLDDCRNIISGAPFQESETESTILADFRSKVEAIDLDAGTRERLIEKAEGALLGSVRPAYRELIGHVEHLEAVATDDDGVWKLPEGDAFYAQQLRNRTTMDLSAEEIHEIGLREVDRIHDEMRSIMREVGFEGDLPQFFEFMREDERFYYSDDPAGRQAYLEGALAIIETMKRHLDELFSIKPRADIVVKAVEPFREKSAGKAFYQRPSPDGTRPGVYYANLYRMRDMPTYQMEALAYHEGIPGHHMQLAILNELEGLPRFRKYLRYTAHTEGWGLYSEYIPKEIGFYKDPYSDFGRLAMELWRACRLVVDTGIHSKRWTREEAIAYLVENTPNPEGDAIKAIERYIVMPGQATAYKIGMIKILELRQKARNALGESFEVREFHDLILENGPVPLHMLEDFVDTWIEARKTSG